MDTVDVAKLKAPIVYIRLHGMIGQPYLYGDPGFVTALSAEQVALADFMGSIVFLEGCYGADVPGIRDMVDAFIEAGAVAVAGSQKATWGYSYRMGPSSIVGREFLERLTSGASVAGALAAGRGKVATPYAEGWTIAGDASTKLTTSERTKLEVV